MEPDDSKKELDNMIVRLIDKLEMEIGMLKDEFDMYKQLIKEYDMYVSGMKKENQEWKDLMTFTEFKEDRERMMSDGNKRSIGVS